jgi:GNAT superfamily N-acetyltransferase
LCDRLVDNRIANALQQSGKLMTADPSETVLIRRARGGEDVTLTALVMRSVQQQWNYSAEFMAWNPEEIAIAPHHLIEMITNVLEVGGRVVGLYVLRGEAPEMELSRMMIEPDMIGQGYGRVLWDHAVEIARGLGVREITIDGDPNAEGFYQRMGAETVGEHEWSPPMMPDWHVKIMKYTIPTGSDS